MGNTESQSIGIDSLLEQLVKRYHTYDVYDRIEYTYEAPVDAAHGAPCLKTQYVYSGTSYRVTKMKESNSTWDSSYDI